MYAKLIAEATTAALDSPQPGPLGGVIRLPRIAVNLLHRLTITLAAVLTLTATGPLPVGAMPSTRGDTAFGADKHSNASASERMSQRATHHDLPSRDIDMRGSHSTRPHACRSRQSLKMPYFSFALKRIRQ